MKGKNVLLLLVIVLLGSGCGSTAKDIGLLREMAKDEKEKENVLKQETEAYEKIREALDEGRVEPGWSEEQVRDAFGDPVIVNQENGMTRYAYKPGNASWFEDRKVYLYFDSGGTLVKIEQLRPAETP